MEQSMSLDRLSDMRGANVYDSDGEKIGSVEEIFYDEETNQPEWIGIGTGFFGTKRVLVPVQGASFDGGEVRVPYSKDQVKSAPDVDSDEISQDTEYELGSYYGLGYSERRSDTGLPEGGTGTATGTYGGGSYDAGVTRADSPGDVETAGEGGYVTRSEEELRVGKREVEAGRVRLRKWVETEPVETDVELRRETVRVEREPINERVSGAEIGEEEVDVTLRSEEAVVDKEVIGRERIRLDKDVETERETVRDEVRRERVEVEGDETVDTVGGDRYDDDTLRR